MFHKASRCYHRVAIASQRLLIRDKSPIAEALAVHSPNHRGHLRLGVHRSAVMPSLELVNVPIQMLGSHLVVDAMVAALERRPKRLEPVRVSPAVHVLADAMLDGLIPLRDAHVSRMFVGVDGSV